MEERNLNKHYENKVSISKKKLKSKNSVQLNVLNYIYYNEINRYNTKEIFTVETKPNSYAIVYFRIIIRFVNK